MRATRLAFGTGSIGGQVQRNVGQEEFTRLANYAYYQGIRFFETAESYGEMHRMLGVALKGIPRDSYRHWSIRRLGQLTRADGRMEFWKLSRRRRL